MAHTVVLQDWTTIQGNASSTVVTQPADGWADLAMGRDVVVFTEVADKTNTIELAFQTSPAKDDVLFQAMAAASSPSVGITTSVLDYSRATVPLARYLRWKLSGGATGAWGLTFRILLAVNVPRRFRNGARAAAGGGCTKQGGCGGSCGGKSPAGSVPVIPGLAEWIADGGLPEGAVLFSSGPSPPGPNQPGIPPKPAGLNQPCNDFHGFTPKCTGGSCALPGVHCVCCGDTYWKMGTCVDFDDESNCGACGNVCPPCPLIGGVKFCRYCKKGQCGCCLDGSPNCHC